LFTIAERPFLRLDEEQQKIVTEELSAAVRQVDADSRRDNESASAALAKQGIEWLSPSAEESSEWFAMAGNANEQLIREDYVSESLYQEMLQHLEQYRSENGDR
jgi:TRAP-type C4-dicarboxylate transport system substrate-binding protein